MTTLLHEAFKKASRLPEIIQDEIASQLIEDIENEIGWETAFEETEDKLAEKAFSIEKASKMTPEELNDKIVTGILVDKDLPEYTANYQRLIEQLRNR